MYVNVGALVEGRRPKTKKALVHAIKNHPEQVEFDQTAAFFSTTLPNVLTLNTIPDGVILSVVGPDPYRKRDWYATVKGGKVS